MITLKNLAYLGKILKEKLLMRFLQHGKRQTKADRRVLPSVSNFDYGAYMDRIDAERREFESDPYAPRRLTAEETEILNNEKNELWAMSYGFSDADEMKEWCAQNERERLAELAERNSALSPAPDLKL